MYYQLSEVPFQVRQNEEETIMTIEEFIVGLHLKNLIVGLFLIGFGFLMGFVLSRVTIRFTTPFSGKARGKSLGRVVQWLTLVSFTVIGVLVLFGASDATLAVVLAALTFALTFGLQNIIQNFIAGLMIAIDGRLQIGQWVEIGDQPLQSE
jgi:small-conductance mechanosensitive channel